jgi:hypothetical protein
MPDVLDVAERLTSAFQMARLSVDVVCAGDSEPECSDQLVLIGDPDLRPAPHRVVVD